MEKATSKKSVEEQTTPAEAAPIITYKGFDKDLKCRYFQYEIGKEYVNNAGASACNYGFHACEHPLNVFDYYAPAGSRFAIVGQSGELSRNNSDTKVASSKITIKAEIGIPGLVEAAVEYVTSRCNPANEDSPACSTGCQGAASSTGHQGAASSTGCQGAASSTGDKGAASSTGDKGAASSTGDQGAASSTGYQGAASSTGHRGAASSTGCRGAASSTGKHSVAMACGIAGKAKASEGSAIVLCYRDADAGGDEYGRIVHIKAAIAGRDGIKPDVWYVLNAGGQLEEATE